MSHFLEIVSILIISVTKQSVYGSTHALVGNYSELNPKDCGITRFTPNLDYSCFKWYKNIVEGMKGRNATEDEVPWIVHLVIWLPTNDSVYCTGAFIAENWVLTAAHCLAVNDAKKYYIYSGTDPWPEEHPNNTYFARGKRIFKHTGFKYRSYDLHDIGLIELDRSFNSIGSNESRQQFNASKSICLPQKNVFNDKQELALFGGWGQVDRYQWPLQVGVRLIDPSDDYSSVYSGSYIRALKMDNLTLTCQGDSGGPLWQYYNGRAVIIGIYSTRRREKNNTSQCQAQNSAQQESPSWFTRVSKYIDWIKSVTQLN